jgi:hypothetical protein
MRPGLGSVVLKESVGTGLRGISKGSWLGVALLEETFWELESFVGLRGLLFPLGLGGSRALKPDFRSLGLGGSLALGISPPATEAFTEESRSMSYGALCDWQTQKTAKHKEIFKLSLPIGLTHSESSSGAFWRSWSRRWVGSWITDLDSGCLLSHNIMLFLWRRRRRRSSGSLALACSSPRSPDTRTCR